MQTAILIKVAFWLVVIGLFALITPNPAWPEWFARMVLSTGFALGITALLVKWWRSR